MSTIEKTLPATVTLPTEEYLRLLQATLVLEALHAAGVDNWEGYYLANRSRVKEGIDDAKEALQNATHELPAELKGLALAHVEFDVDSGYTADEVPVEEIHRANIVTSKIAGTAWHKPVLDIDLPVTVIPSSTPGHFHLVIDRWMSWPRYARLLQELALAGVLQTGYVNASLSRGHTAIRLPWVKKEGA